MQSVNVWHEFDEVEDEEGDVIAGGMLQPIRLIEPRVSSH